MVNYKKLGFNTLEEYNKEFLNTLLKTNQTYEFFVEWEKVFKKYVNSMFNFIFIPEGLNSSLGNNWLPQKLALIEKEDGLVISEYPNNLEPQPQWFIIRNRIIAYASRALVVISARKNSGSVTTISFATEADREIFCCPTGIDEDSVCNELIRDGAHIVTCGEDILYYLGLDS